MDDFLREFHQRRREEAVSESGVRSLWVNFTDWLLELGATKWAYGAGLAYATILVGMVIAPTSEKSPGSLQNVGFDEKFPAEAQSTPVLEQLDELDLSPDSKGKFGEQEF